MLQTIAPFPLYLDAAGQPLDGGYVYFGTSGLNPETSPITVYWDLAGTQPAAQPIRTKGGYAVRNGTAAAVYVTGDHSVTVRDAQMVMVYYKPINYGAATAAQAVPGGGDGGLGYYNVKDYGAIGDGTTDDTAAIQAATTAAQNSGLGGVVWFPDGEYKMTSGITLDYSANVNTNPPKVSFVGASMSSARVTGAAGNFTMFRVIGGTLGGVFALLRFENLLLNKTGTQGGCLYTDNIAYLTLTNVMMGGGADQWIAVDTLGVRGTNVSCIFGTRGITAYQNDFAPPNSWSFHGLTLGDQAEYGARIIRPSVFAIYGGGIEGCGLNAGVGMSTSYYGIKVENPGQGGGVGLILDGVYVESNGGIADVWITGTDSLATATNSIKGCTFNRISNTRYVKHNVLVEATGADAVQMATVTTCGFKDYNSYVADAARPCLAITESGGGVARLHHGDSLFQSAVSAPGYAARSWTTGQQRFLTSTTNPTNFTTEAVGISIGHIEPSGGAGDRSPFTLDLQLPSGYTANARAILARITSAATAGEAIAIRGEVHSSASGGSILAGIFQSKDTAGDASTTGSSILYLEGLANGAGGVVGRNGLTLNFGKANGGGSQATFSRGIGFGVTSNDKTQAKLANGLYFGLNVDGAMIKMENAMTARYIVETENAGNINYFLRTTTSKPMWTASPGSTVGGIKVVIDGQERCLLVANFTGSGSASM